MLHGNLYPYENDRSVEGKTIVTKGTNVNIRSTASTTGKVLKTVAASGTAVGKGSGRVWYDTNPAYKWYEIDGNPLMYIRNDLATLTGEAKAIPAATPKNSDEEAQSIMDSITAQDTETLNNLNLAAGMIEALKTKGVNTTTSANKLSDIFKRLQERQEALQKSTWGKVKDKISSGWGAVKKFFGFSGVGGHLGIVFIPVAIAIIGVAAGAGATALVILKPWKSKSDIDLKESKELKALLDNADPAVAQKIRTELKGQIVDAYDLAERRTNVANTLNFTKYIGIALAVAIGMVILNKKVLNKM